MKRSFYFLFKFPLSNKLIRYKVDKNFCLESSRYDDMTLTETTEYENGKSW